MTPVAQVATEETPIIEALHKFVNKRVSALPIVDKEVGIKEAKTETETETETKRRRR